MNIVCEELDYIGSVVSDAARALAGDVAIPPWEACEACSGSGIRGHYDESEHTCRACLGSKRRVAS